MPTPRISASSYSNTAPLIWSFLYGSQRGRVEMILDNAPARSAELLSQDRVDAALVPVITFQQLDGMRLVPNVCVGAKDRARSVCLVTRGKELEDVRSVALDTSSKTSVVLTKIIFRHFLGREPEWRDARPDLESMLDTSDCALLIGDPALSIWDLGFGIGDFSDAAARTPEVNSKGRQTAQEPDTSSKSAIRNPQSALNVFDLAELWHRFTGLGFVFAMWMTRRDLLPLDFAAARDEGLMHLDEIVSNYDSEIGLNRTEIMTYLSQNIRYSIDDSMQAGLELYFKLAGQSGLIDGLRPLRYLEQA